MGVVVSRRSKPDPYCRTVYLKGMATDVINPSCAAIETASSGFNPGAPQGAPFLYWSKVSRVLLPSLRDTRSRLGRSKRIRVIGWKEFGVAAPREVRAILSGRQVGVFRMKRSKV